MSTPVDLTNIHSITEGDRAMEKELFEQFFKSFDEAFGLLESACGQKENAAWRSNAHALKGISLNVGGTELGRLCTQAQESYLAPPDEKKAILESIRAEYIDVRTFLLQQCAA
jgi:HPt (histidine-containing phosphotransfer) domain-containing protein